MYKFGKIPPRSVNSFGVAGLLGENCHVFYESIFTACSLGRISDVLSAQLRDSGIDELKLRTLLLFGVFEVYQSHFGETTGQRNLPEPLVLECGVDSEKVAIGVAFNLPAGKSIQVAGLEQRIASNAARDMFEELLAVLYRHSDRTVLKLQASASRVEIVSMLGIPDRIDPAELKERAPLTVFQLDQIPQIEVTGSANYVQLADMDYASLLRQSAKGNSAESREAVGAVLAKGSAGLAEAVKVKGAPPAENQDEVRVPGGADAGEEKRTVHGKPEEADGTKKSFDGESTDLFDQTKLKVEGKAERIGDEKFVVAGGQAEEQLQEYRVRVSELENEIRQLREQKAKAGKHAAGGPPEGADEVIVVPGNRAEGAESSGTEAETVVEEPASEGGFFSRMVKKAWPFRKKSVSLDEEQVEPEESAAEPLDDTPAEVAKKAAGKSKPKAKSPARSKAEATATEGGDADSADEPAETLEVGSLTDSTMDEGGGVSEYQPTPPSNEVANDAENLESEINSGELKEKLERAQDEIRKNIKDPTTRRWMDGLVNDLLSERARLAEMAKKVNLSVRHKELEFRNRESTLMEELRRKEDTSRKNALMLGKAREQIHQLSQSLDKARGSGGGVSDELNKKYQSAQKQIISTKEENNRLNLKLEELKIQVSNLQQQQKTRNTTSPTEFAVMKSKLERTSRQYEQMKTLNDQLNQKVKELAEKADTTKMARNVNAATDDLKRKLEAVTKQSVVHQKEVTHLQARAEKLQSRVEELEKEEGRLKKELLRSQAEARAAKAASGKPGGKPDPSQAA